ncbi:MAG: hypothetical protein ACXW18_00770 [Pyrinomonadaceae bacterium]
MPKARKSKGKGVLSDHAKVGKRLLPPMLRAGPVRPISLGRDIIPEFFWLALLNNHYGWQRGAELSLALARGAAQVNGVVFDEFSKPLGAGPKELFATTTAYGTLDNRQKKELVDDLNASKQLAELKEAIQPLISFYPICPFAFLFDGSPAAETKEHLALLKVVITELYDKYSKPAVSMFANAVYIALCTNKLKVMEGSLLSRFPEIEKYPGTEESRGVAAAARATVYSLLSSTPPDWGIYFWNRGLEFDPCEYDEVIRNEIRRLMESN